MKKIVLLFVFMVLVSCQKKETPQITSEENTEVIELLTSDEFAEHIKSDNVQLIDVRMKSEFDEGHIKGAKNFHIYGKEFQDSILTLDKEKPVYVYCKAGARSEEAALELKKVGFKKVYDLKGGFSSWKNRE